MNLSRTYKLSFLRTRVTAAGCRERGIVGPDPKTPLHLRVGVHYFTCLLPALTPKLFICRVRFQTRLRACLTCFDCIFYSMAGAYEASAALETSAHPVPVPHIHAVPASPTPATSDRSRITSRMSGIGSGSHICGIACALHHGHKG